MAYDEGLAQRIREKLDEHSGITEKKMFGGIAFMLNGNMSVGVVKNDLCVRCGKEAADQAAGQLGARPMDFTGRPMKGWLFVSEEGTEADEALDEWIALGINYASSFPAK